MNFRTQRLCTLGFAHLSSVMLGILSMFTLFKHLLLIIIHLTLKMLNIVQLRLCLRNGCLNSGLLQITLSI